MSSDEDGRCAQIYAVVLVILVHVVAGSVVACTIGNSGQLDRVLFAALYRDRELCNLLPEEVQLAIAKVEVTRCGEEIYPLQILAEHSREQQRVVDKFKAVVLVLRLVDYDGNREDVALPGS